MTTTPDTGPCRECGSSVPGWRHFRGCSHDTLTDEEAVHEVGWVARRARELLSSWTIPHTREECAQWAEFYDRKARLLRHIEGGDDGLAAAAESAALAYKPGGAYWPAS